MQEEIQKLLNIYPSARQSSPFKGPHDVQHTFQQLKADIEKIPVISDNSNLLVKYSYGKGNWATVPWIAVLDSRETTSTQDGTYIVLLFQENGEGCHLKLAQGVTAIKNSMGKLAANELGRRAKQIRDMFPEMSDSGFDLTGDPRLGAEKGIAKLYEASTIFSKYWITESVPSDDEIIASIEKLVDVYSRYVDKHLEEEDDDVEEIVASTEDERRIWAISPGERGRLWENFQRDGVIAIGWDKLGSFEQYTDQDSITRKLQEVYGLDTNPYNSSLACHSFSREIKVGDIIVAKAGRKRILGMGTVLSEYFFDDSAPEYKSRRKVEWVRTDPAEFPGTGIAIKTLTELTMYQSTAELVYNYLNLDPLHSRFDEESDEEAYKPSESYSIENILDEGCFLGATELRSILDRLRLKKNVILQGPPGTGKTWLAKRLAYALIGRKERSRLRSVQFHPNLSYEDFIRGWRPSGDGKLTLVDGAFMEVIEDAKNTSKPHVIVIEEINRGNPAQIFGEMLTLLEADKRKASESLELSYRKHLDERVFIPPNLFVIGTMNVADRSLALVDMALRRRFSFIEMKPLFNQVWRKWLENEIGVNQAFISRIESRLIQLNETISADPSLGPQFCVGHSYLTPPSDAQISDCEDWFNQVVHTEIGPLISEYWYDEPTRVEEMLAQLLA